MFIRLFFAFFITLFSIVSSAASTIPAQLLPWVSWVKKDHLYLDCPYINHADFQRKDSHLCAWPSPLKLQVDNSGGTFEQQWQILQKSLIPLPGDKHNWPQNVSANGKPLVVVSRNNQPYAELTVGRYELKGVFVWQRLPQSLEVPEQYASVNLTLNNKVVDFAKMEKGELWLSEPRLENPQSDSSTIEVYRLVKDGAFISLITQIQLKVSGKKREQALGKVLPPGFSLVGIQGDITAYLDAEGILHAKLQPGSWQLNVVAYADANLTSWQHSATGFSWPQQEVWAFEADNRFRTGKIKGGASIDISQTQMPKHWQNNPTYLLNPGESLTYAVSARGQAEQTKNQLVLERDLWLDFDAKQLTFVDSLSGNMQQHWRLNMAPPYHLESASTAQAPILITHSDNNSRGMELRYYDLNVEATGTLDSVSDIPVSGWDSEFEKVDMNLNLPPSYRLFAVFGADSAQTTWLGQWSIWGVFVVLFCAILVTRLFSPLLGVLTVIILLLTLYERLSPVSLMVNLIFACLAVKHLPLGKLQKLAKGYLTISAVLFGINALAFAATQLREAIHPQLESKNHFSAVKSLEADYLADAPPKAKVARQFSSPPEMEVIRVAGSAISMPDKMARYQTDVNIQAGPGIPDWHWARYTISWNSPVAVGQKVTLVIQPAWLTRLLKVLAVLLMALWLALLFKNHIKQLWLNALPKTAAALLLIGLITPYGSNVAYAESLPDEQMLKALQQRVLEAPKCAPQCVAIANMTVDISLDNLTLDMQVHALTDSAIVLPSSLYWRPQKVSINGTAEPLMLKWQDNIYLAVKSGISTVKLQGAIAPVEQFQLLFENLPQRLNVNSAKDWDVVGIDEQRLSANALSFTIQAQQTNVQRQNSRYLQHPIVTTMRTLDLQNQWLVTTEISRIAPLEGAINLEVPLLAGEHITSADIKVVNNTAQVAMDAKQTRLVWTSTLDISDKIILQAPNQQRTSYQWRISSAPTWHVRTTGLPTIAEAVPSINEDAQDIPPVQEYSYASAQYFPYPGESLTLEISKPDAVKGDILAIDRVTSTLNQGERSARYELSFNYRATKGSEHVIELPTDFELVEVKVDDALLNLQSDNGKLRLPISPNEHQVDIFMRKDTTPTALLSMPQSNLNAATSNITSTIALTNTRWILYADGPVIGPAVIYWGELLVFVVLAFLLGRYRFSPLSPSAWLLLGLGLSLHSWWMLSAVAFWFAMLTLSQKRSPEMSRNQYNLSQLGLYFLSLVTLYNLIMSIPASLLGRPDMGIVGNNSSSNQLQWFSDKSLGLTPQIEVFNVSIYIYKGLMLLWVLWLSFALIKWCKWAWQCLGQQGYWRESTADASQQKPQESSQP